MTRLDHFLSLSYWLQAAPGPLVPLGLGTYVVLAGLFALGLGWSLAGWRRRGRRAAPFALEAALCVAGLGTVALRLAGMPGFSARLWAAGPSVLALALAALLSLPPLELQALRENWGALWAFRPAALEPAARTSAILLAGHLLGLTVAARLAGAPAWLGLALLLALLAPQALAARRRPSAVALNALLPLYLLAILELARLLPPFGGQPWAAWGPLRLYPALAILGAYAWAYQVHEASPRAVRARLAYAPPLLLAGVCFAWAAWAYFRLSARGVTGSDPYCYVQMAVDLVQHGTLLHRFPLTALAQQLGIDPQPLLHIGYRWPADALGWAPTVWPAGHAVLLGLAGRLFGQGAIYLVTPLMALGSAAATLWLGLILFDDLELPLRWLAASLAALLVATSSEELRWLVVHMADISAQLFSILTVALAWLGARRGRRPYLAAAGLALAMAYWIRHAQLAMAAPALLVLSTGRRSRRSRLLDGVTYLGAAFLGALPDLVYHWRLFGSPLQPESRELALYTLRAIPATTVLLLKGWLGAPELAYLAPFLLAGAVALYRRDRRAGLTLALWLAGLWLVQAPYASLRLRDLLPALPALALLAGYGVARAVAWLAHGRRAGVPLLALGLAGLLWLRTVGVVSVSVRRDFNNFGYLWASQRQEFATLQAATEPNAVVGSTLNGGPVDLYAGRETFRPAAWRPEELQRFLQALWAAGRPTYLLLDGQEMEGVLAAVGSFARVTPVRALHQIPFYVPGGGSDLRDVVLYRVGP